MTPPLQQQPVTVVVNGVALPPRLVQTGVNTWLLPLGSITGREELRIELRIDHTVRPADISESHDDRPLGVGLRGLRVYRDATT